MRAGRVSLAAAGLLLGAAVWAGRADTRQSGMQRFDSGDFVLWDIHADGRCTGPCIRTERRGNVLVNEVFGIDATRVKLDVYGLAGRVRDLLDDPVPLTVSIPPTDRLVGELLLPPAGEQPLSVSCDDGYTNSTHIWMRNVEVRYAGGRVVDVLVQWTAYGPPA